jgi:hypothetical protein
VEARKILRGGKMNKGSLPLGIMALTIATAMIHLVLSFQFPNGPDLIFMLNGLGYLALLALLLLPLPMVEPFRGVVRWALLGYTALTVLLWLFVGARSPIAYLDKLIEIGLLILLWLEQPPSTQRSE